jgi:hypothetical protein
MTTQPRTRRILHRAALVASGVTAGVIALTVTLVTAVGHSSAATTPTNSTSSTSNDSGSGSSDSGSSSSSDDGSNTGISSGSQTQAPVGGSNGS